MKKTMKLMAVMAMSVSVASMAAADGHANLNGKTIGVAVVGTQHFWDREAFNGAVSTVEELGGTVVPVDGGRDNQVHADNHDILLNQKVDAVISILGDGAVERMYPEGHLERFLELKRRVDPEGLLQTNLWRRLFGS